MHKIDLGNDYGFSYKSILAMVLVAKVTLCANDLFGPYVIYCRKSIFDMLDQTDGSIQCTLREALMRIDGVTDIVLDDTPEVDLPTIMAKLKDAGIIKEQ